MREVQLRLDVVEWLRESAGFTIETESREAIVSAIRAELVADKGIFIGGAELERVLVELHQTPIERKGRWTWHPRVPLLEYWLGVLEVQSWIATKPGPLVAPTVDELWQLALNRSGKNVSLQQVQTAFKDFDVVPERCQSASGTYWVLAVPSEARRYV